MKVKRLKEILKNCPDHYDVYYFGIDDDNNREIESVETLVGYGEVILHEEFVNKSLPGMMIENSFAEIVESQKELPNEFDKILVDNIDDFLA